MSGILSEFEPLCNTEMQTGDITMQDDVTFLLCTKLTNKLKLLCRTVTNFFSVSCLRRSMRFWKFFSGSNFCGTEIPGGFADCYEWSWAAGVTLVSSS